MTDDKVEQLKQYTIIKLCEYGLSKYCTNLMSFPFYLST